MRRQKVSGVGYTQTIKRSATLDIEEMDENSPK